MAKEEFIGKCLDNSRKLKNHKLPYGMQYLNLLAEIEEKAERKWNKIINHMEIELTTKQKIAIEEKKSHFKKNGSTKHPKRADKGFAQKNLGKKSRNNPEY